MGDKEGPSSSRSSGECSGRMMMMLMMLMRLRLVRNKEMIACARPPARPSAHHIARHHVVNVIHHGCSSIMHHVRRCLHGAAPFMYHA